MKIIVCGASGFVGRAVVARLQAEGHQVQRGVRRPRAPDDLRFDYADAADRRAWAARLVGIDAVVNAVGTLVESRGRSYDDLHAEGPRALFDACIAAGVGRVVQVSALGADRGTSGYFRSKRTADEHLMSLPLAWQILRPSLIFGDDGWTGRAFRLLASLPVHPVPGDGEQMLQPVHVDDVAQAVARLLDPDTPPRQCVEAVGAAPVALRDLLAVFRRSMKGGPAVVLPVPAPLVDAAAQLLGRVPGSMLTAETWAMLQAGSTGDPAPLRQLLGREPRPAEDFVRPSANPLERCALRMGRRGGVAGAARRSRPREPEKWPRPSDN